MLLDLPPKLINIVTGYISPPPIWSRMMGHCPFDACECLPQEDPDRQLMLYDYPDSRPADSLSSKEKNALRFGTVHPYLARCIANGGWQGVIEMSDVVDIGALRRIPAELRAVVSTVDLRRVPLSTILSAELQSILHQFPAIRRMDLEFHEARSMTALDLVNQAMGESSSALDTSKVTSPDPSFQIIDLVFWINCEDIQPLVSFATSFPLPLLTRLHMTMPFTIGAWPRPQDVEEYTAIFDQLERIAHVWRSLESVQVCVQVLLDWSSDDHVDLTIWNLWQIALTSLFRAFRSIPSCRIGLCIAYMFETGAIIPLDQTFHRLPDGGHTLCNRMAPTDEPAVRAFLRHQPVERSIPRFDLCVRHGVEGAPPDELLTVKYCPPSPGPSSVPMDEAAEGILECEFNHERLDELYERAKDEYF